MGLTAAGALPLFCHNGDLGQPPPAHMGIPPYQLDKTAIGNANIGQTNTKIMDDGTSISRRLMCTENAYKLPGN